MKLNLLVLFGAINQTKILHLAGADMRATAFCLTLLVATAFGVPKPQDPVSVDDILGNSAR